MKLKKLTAILFTAVTFLCVAAFSVSALDYTLSDATEIQKYLASLVTLTDKQLALADVDGDGYVSIQDATKIQRISAGLD